LVNDAGKPVRLIGTVQDITERKQVEEDLKKSQQRYEALVNSVDGVVWEADPNTLQSTFVSKQAERLLGHPVAQWLEAPGFWIAHDFNNLLTAIAGYSDLLLSSLRPEDPIRGNLEEIRKAAARAASLTHQLLAFSRQQVLRPVILDLNTLLANIHKMLRRLIGE